MITSWRWRNSGAGFWTNFNYLETHINTTMKTYHHFVAHADESLTHLIHREVFAGKDVYGTTSLCKDRNLSCIPFKRGWNCRWTKATWSTPCSLKVNISWFLISSSIGTANTADFTWNFLGCHSWAKSNESFFSKALVLPLGIDTFPSDDFNFFGKQMMSRI